MANILLKAAILDNIINAAADVEPVRNRKFFVKNDPFEDLNHELFVKNFRVNKELGRFLINLSHFCYPLQENLQLVKQMKVDCETYCSVQQLGAHQRIVHVLHNSEQPATVFSILDTGTKTISLATDGLFDLLMMKMSSFYTSKKQTKAESKGPRYEIGDFCVKLGTVTISQNFKGILVEVEYRPCMVPAMCWELMREFLQGFLGSSVQTAPPPYLQNRMQELYTPTDTIHQYLEHFTMFRKAAGLRQ